MQKWSQTSSNSTWCWRTDAETSRLQSFLTTRNLKEMYPGGVKETRTGAFWQGVKIRWLEEIFERLLKLQSHIASSATGNVQPPVSGNVQPPGPVSHTQHSSSAKAHAVPPASPTPPVLMPPVPVSYWFFPSNRPYFFHSKFKAIFERLGAT